MFNALRGNGGGKFFPRVTQALSFPFCHCQGLSEEDRGRQRALQGLFTVSPASTHLLLLCRQVPALDIKEPALLHTHALLHITQPYFPKLGMVTQRALPSKFTCVLC